jgi:hypothetical protein
VAAIQAAVVIAREPERYGFSVTPEPALRYETIRVPASTKLPRIAADSGIDPVELKRLNPELREAQTPPAEAYALKVPPGGADKVRVVFEREAAQRAVAVGPPARSGDGRRRRRATPMACTWSSRRKRWAVSRSATACRWPRSGAGTSSPSRPGSFPGNRLRVAMMRTATREEGQGGFR